MKWLKYVKVLYKDKTNIDRFLWCLRNTIRRYHIHTNWLKYVKVLYHDKTQNKMFLRVREYYKHIGTSLTN